MFAARVDRAFGRLDANGIGPFQGACHPLAAGENLSFRGGKDRPGGSCDLHPATGPLQRSRVTLAAGEAARVAARAVRQPDSRRPATFTEDDL